MKEANEQRTPHRLPAWAPSGSRPAALNRTLLRRAKKNGRQKKRFAAVLRPPPLPPSFPLRGGAEIESLRLGDFSGPRREEEGRGSSFEESDSIAAAVALVMCSCEHGDSDSERPTQSLSLANRRPIGRLRGSPRPPPVPSAQSLPNNSGSKIRP